MDTPAGLSERARRLYRDNTSLAARIQILRPHICPFEELIPLIPRGATVLDVGCGGGLFLGLLADSGRITDGAGFDSSEAAISLARRMVASLPSRVSIRIRRIDVTEPWPDDAYDVVCLIDVLHHVPPASHSTVLSRALGCVREGGLLLYKDMATRPRWRAACNQAHDLVMARQWIHHVPVAFVEGWASAHGMAQTVQGAAPRYWYAHEWRLFQRLA